jgi:ketosteroid isomerase-like protein
VKDQERPLMQVLEDYKIAVFARDVDGFLALYDDEVRVFDMWGAWSHRGVAAWRAVVDAWFESHRSDHLLVEFSDPQVRAVSDIAVINVFVIYRGVSAEGVELRSMTNRMTLALWRVAGLWKIVHEHTSAPLDHETLKVIVSKAREAA